MRIEHLLQQAARPLVFDGAFGSYYRSLAQTDQACELANLENPALVSQIHADYLAAGAQVIFTNTFAANQTLTQDEAQLRAILAAGLRLAREAAGEDAAVLADIGYMSYQTADTATEETQAQLYRRLVELFLEAGAEDFIFETMAEFEVLRPALQLLQQRKPDAFVLVSFAVSQDGYSKKGLYYQDLLEQALATPGVSGSGLNCVCGPGHILKLLAAFPFQGRLLLAMPNAGYPQQINQRIIYEDNEDYYAARLAEIAALGCSFVGGCCGTTPQHIAKTAALLRAGGVRIPQRPASPAERPPAPTVAEDRGRFLRLLQSGPRPVIIELNPPISADIAQFAEAARKAKAAGAELISVTDSPLARVRADSLVMAARLRRELGVEVMPHLSCRDRNRLGLKAALLAAAIEDVRYLLAVRGDAADEGVFNLNSRELMAFIRSLNREILPQTPFQVGGALNVNAKNFPAELKRAQAKEQAGCQFFLTQPVFDEKALEHLALARQTLQAPLLAGILPVAGYKNAVFLNNEVGGITIPADFIRTLQDTPPAEVEALSLAYSKRLMAAAAPYSAGFYLMTPLNRIDWVCKLTEAVQSL